MSPKLVAYLALSGAIACEVTGTALLQASERFTRLVPSAGVVACYAAAFYLLSLAVGAMPLGVAYAIWASVGTVLITLVGALVFRQSLDAPALVGIGLIVAGVVVMNALSRSVPR